MTDLREELARLAHEQWSGWMRYMLERSFTGPTEGGEVALILPSDLKRWRRQMNTQYADLPEEEKENDRIVADRVLALLRIAGKIQDD